MNKYIEEYDIPSYLFQALNVFFALVILLFCTNCINILNGNNKKYNTFCVKLPQKVFPAKAE